MEIEECLYERRHMKLSHQVSYSMQVPFPLLFKNKFSPKWSRLNKNKHNCTSFSVYSLGFWHLSQLKFEEISPKLQRIQILRTAPPPVYLPPWPPWESKKFLGGFGRLKFEQNINKITKNAGFRKTGPPCWSNIYCPLCGSKNFWEVSGIYPSSSLKKYHQKYQEYRF